MLFLAYSDIHHDEYNNGVTEDDVVNVENQITQYAIQNQIKHIFFLGDWYRATNPNRSVIARAEYCWKVRSDAGISTIALVGNHDRWTKSATSGHAFVSAHIFSKDLENVRVIDHVCFIELEDVNILCIPSGYEGHEELTGFNSYDGRANIVLFHGLVVGSALAHGGGAGSGIHPDILRNLNAHLILGGDNHTPQILDNLLGCPSLYLGAPMQHGWGDNGQARGFWEIKQVPDLEAEIKFVPAVAPRFIRSKISVHNESDAIDKVTSMLRPNLNDNPGIVEITLLGKNVSTINVDNVEKAACQAGARRARIILDKTYERTEVVAGIQELDTPDAKWSMYVSNIDTKGLNPAMLDQMGKWAIQEAKKQS